MDVIQFGPTMRLGPSVIHPRYDGPPDLEPDRIHSAHLARPCLACGERVTIPAAGLAAQSWGRWRQAFSDEEAEYLVRFFDVSTTTGKSHEGGWPVFERLECGSCGTEHVLYAGVREVANDSHAIWVQGFARVMGIHRESGER